MTDAQPPKRLHYSWVVVLAFVMMLGWLFWSAMLSSGSSRIIEWATFMTVFMGVVLALPLAAWLAMIWGVYHAKRSWHGRTWLAILPSGLLFASTMIDTVKLPSREARLRHQFKRLFAAEIPADAHEVDSTPPTLADSGHYEFIFRCSKESTQALIERLRAQPLEGQAVGSNRLVKDWSAERWQGVRAYEHVDKAGTQNLLITESTMESVLVRRWPGWAKPASEMSR